MSREPRRFSASLDRHPGREALHAWLAKTYGLHDELVEVREGDSGDDAKLLRPPYGPPPLFAQIERRGVDSFPFELSVSSDWVQDPWREISALCRHFRCRALADDGTANPYTRMLMDENGASWWVALDAEVLDADVPEEEEVIAGPCSEPEGSLSFAAPVDVPALRGLLAAAFAVGPEQVRADEYSYDPDPLDRAGFESGYPIIRGQHFRHALVVTVSRDPRSWEPRQEAARSWINRAAQVARRLGTRLCIGHPAFEADSQRHCYYWDGEGLQRFVYKETKGPA